MTKQYWEEMDKARAAYFNNTQKMKDKVVDEIMSLFGPVIDYAWATQSGIREIKEKVREILNKNFFHDV